MPPVRKPRPKLRRTFLKEWRDYRGLTQEQAADRLNIDRSTLSRIERGESPYNQGLLEAAAEAYRCEPWDLLNVNPLMAGDVIDMIDRFRGAAPNEQRQALDFLEFQRNRSKEAG